MREVGRDVLGAPCVAFRARSMNTATDGSEIRPYLARAVGRDVLGAPCVALRARSMNTAVDGSEICPYLAQR